MSSARPQRLEDRAHEGEEGDREQQLVRQDRCRRSRPGIACRKASSKKPIWIDEEPETAKPDRAESAKATG
jgi:hypothetical protein